MKDTKGHGSNSRGSESAADAAKFGGRWRTDKLGLTYRADGAGGQPVSSNAEAAQRLMGSLHSTQAPVHSSMLLRSNREK